MSAGPSPRLPRPGRGGALLSLSAVLFISIILYFFNVTAPLDYALQDLLTRTIAPAEAKDRRIAVALIDDETLQRLSIHPPIPRALFAELVRKTHRLGARVVALDLQMTPTEDRKGEDDLIRAAGETGAAIFNITWQRRGGSSRVIKPFGGRPEADRLNLAVPDIVRRAGCDRAVQAYIADGDSLYFSLAIKAVSLLTGEYAQVLDQDPPGARRPWYLPRGFAVKVGERVYHLVGRDEIPIAWKRTEDATPVEIFRFEEILRREYSPGFFRGKVVIVGAAGKMSGDIHPTPLGLRYGVLVHATALGNLLDNRFVYPLRPELVILLTVLCGILCAVLFTRLRPAASLLALVALLLAVCAAAIALFHRDIALEASPLIVTALALYLSLSYARAKRVDEELLGGLTLLDRMRLSGEGEAERTEMLAAMLAMSCRSVDADAGWIQSKDGSGAPSLEASWSLPGGAAPGDMAGGLCEEAHATGTLRHTTRLDREAALSSLERSRGLRSLLCVPLKVKGKVAGVMAMGRRSSHPFTPFQAQQMALVGAVAGALLENVKLGRRLQALFLEAIAALAQAVDARDSATYGHSSRVSLLAGALARSLGMSCEEAKKLEIAGLLHDVGKIGVPEDLIRKGGSLTEEEEQIMRSHPRKGVDILRPLDELYELLPSIAAHHEKCDGSGYPGGLKKHEIPLGARIIAVANVYDELLASGRTAEEALAAMKERGRADLDSAAVAALEKWVRENPGGAIEGA